MEQRRGHSGKALGPLLPWAPVENLKVEHSTVPFYMFCLHFCVEPLVVLGHTSEVLPKAVTAPPGRCSRAPAIGRSGRMGGISDNWIVLLNLELVAHCMGVIGPVLYRQGVVKHPCTIRAADGV